MALTITQATLDAAKQLTLQGDIDGAWDVLQQAFLLAQTRRENLQQLIELEANTPPCRKS